jgi:hypothetical protein
VWPFLQATQISPLKGAWHHLRCLERPMLAIQLLKNVGGESALGVPRSALGVPGTISCAIPPRSGALFMLATQICEPKTGQKKCLAPFTLPLGVPGTLPLGVPGTIYAALNSQC